MSVDITLDRGSPVPLYFQLSQQLETAIADGRLQPGDRIDTEIDIAAKHGLSRPTVRQAIQVLVNKGLLVRRRGVGTQVVHGQVRRQLGLTSLFDDLSRSGHHPRTDLLETSRLPAPAEVSSALQLAPGAEVLRIERLRYDGREPLAHMLNWLPGDTLSDDAVEALATSGLYEQLRSLGVHLRIAHQRIGARSASAAEAKLMGIGKGAPLLTMERTAFDETGRPVEYGSHAYRADSYTFETTLMDH